jgi:hypothetical protein
MSEYERNEPTGDSDGDSINVKLTGEGIIVDAFEADLTGTVELVETWALTYDELWEFVTNRRGK